MGMRDDWKNAGVGIGHAFKGLGKAFATTAKTAIRKADEWANSDDNADSQQQNESTGNEK